jgi:hypothetical protein
MEPNEILALVSRVRRAMPRNVEVMGLCDELERAITRPRVRPKFDRAAYQRAYMREYMRGYRKRKGAETETP